MYARIISIVTDLVPIQLLILRPRLKEWRITAIMGCASCVAFYATLCLPRRKLWVPRVYSNYGRCVMHGTSCHAAPALLYVIGLHALGVHGLRIMHGVLCHAVPAWPQTLGSGGV